MIYENFFTNTWIWKFKNFSEDIDKTFQNILTSVCQEKNKNEIRSKQ